MATATVDVVVQTGPRFYDDEREKDVMFVHVIDGATKIGPRPVTDADKAAHPAAWAAYEARAAEPEPEESGEEVEEEEAEPDETGKPARRVRIPADWKDKDAASRKKLAGKIAGREITTAAEADMIVRAEVDKREDRSWP